MKGLKKNRDLLSFRVLTEPVDIQVRILYLFVFFIGFTINAQVTSSIDSAQIKIGEQITYTIQVEADSTDLVLFPEGQSFSPLEMIESF